MARFGKNADEIRPQRKKDGQFDKQLCDHHNVNNCFGENLTIKTM